MKLRFFGCLSMVGSLISNAAMGYCLARAGVTVLNPYWGYVYGWLALVMLSIGGGGFVAGVMYASIAKFRDRRQS